MTDDNPFIKYATGKNVSKDNPFAKYASPQTSPNGEEKTSLGADVAKGLGSGLAEGTIGLVTGPFDFGANVTNWAINKAAGSHNQPPELTDTVAKKLGVDYEPKTGTGRIAQIVGEAAPAFTGIATSAMKKGVESIAKSAGNLVTKENSSLLETARKFGIPVFRSQVSKSQPTKMAGSIMKDFPLSGTEGKITEQVEKFNDAVMKTMGGEGSVTPENLGKAYDKITNTYKELTGKYNIKVTPELDNALLELSEKAQVQLAGDPAKLKAFHDYWDLTIDNMKSGEISGKTYQRIRSGIGTTLRSDNSSPELGELQRLIDDHFAANMPPKDAQRFDEARQQYRNMIAVEKVLKTGEKGQGISPARLQSAVKQVFGDYAYGGDTDLEQLARLGTILKDTFPQSGTAPRNLANDVAKELARKGAGAALGLGGAGIPIAASRWLGTPYLYQDVTKSPEALANIQRFLGGNGIEDALKGVKSLSTGTK